MKTILATLALWVVIGCASSYRDIQQVDMVEAHVVKIDTVWRHPEQVKQITWKDTDDIQYVTYVALHNNMYPMGTSVYVMRKR